MRRLLSLAILALHAGPARPAGETAAGESSWISAGPGGGGHQQGPSISPHDTHLYFDGCDMGGFYRSTDRGKVWRMDPSVNAVTSPAIFHPADPRVIYVFNWYGDEFHHGWRLFRSNDAGLTWKALHTYVGTYSTNLGRCLAIDPARPDWLLAGMASLEGEVPGKILVSTSGGNFFRAVDLDVPDDADVLGLTIDFKSDARNRRIFAGTTRGVFVSKDGGARFARLPEQPGDGALTHFVSSQKSPGGPLTLYAVTPVHGQAGGLHLSRDGGERWVCATPALSAAVKDPGGAFRIRAIAASDADPNVLYVSVNGNRYGVYKSEDGGKTFVYQLPGENFKPVGGHYEAGWCTLDPHFGFGWGAEAMDLAACATDPNLVLWTDDGRTIGTTDGGKTWQQLYTNHVKDHWWSSRGLEVTSAYDVFFDPKHHDRVYATYTDITLFRSEDHGKSWTYSADGMAERNTVYDLAMDPDNPQILYAANAANHDIPEFKMLRLDKRTFKGGEERRRRRLLGDARRRSRGRPPAGRLHRHCAGSRQPAGQTDPLCVRDRLRRLQIRRWRPNLGAQGQRHGLSEKESQCLAAFTGRRRMPLRGDHQEHRRHRPKARLRRRRRVPFRRPGRIVGAGRPEHARRAIGAGQRIREPMGHSGQPRRARGGVCRGGGGPALRPARERRRVPQRRQGRYLVHDLLQPEYHPAERSPQGSQAPLRRRLQRAVRHLRRREDLE
jgi:photosystem II stability/assembly factor-like uncharacterized protein